MVELTDAANAATGIVGATMVAGIGLAGANMLFKQTDRMMDNMNPPRRNGQKKKCSKKKANLDRMNRMI